MSVRTAKGRHPHQAARHSPPGLGLQPRPTAARERVPRGPGAGRVGVDLRAHLQATCRLVPSSPERSLVVLGYPDIPSSGDDVEWLMGFAPIGCEFTSQHVLDNLEAKGMRVGRADVLPEGQAWLLLEFGGDTKAEANKQAEALFAALGRRRHAPSHRLYESAADETAVWEIRPHSAGTSRMPVEFGDQGGWPNWEDAAVTPAAAFRAPRRDVPRFATQTFTDWFATHPARHPDGPPVLLWPDTFTTYFDPQIGRDTVAVLEAAGYPVLLPSPGLCCGRPLYDYGMLTLARHYLRRILADVSPLIRQGARWWGWSPAVSRCSATNWPTSCPTTRPRSGCTATASRFRSFSPDTPGTGRCHRWSAACLVRPSLPPPFGDRVRRPAGGAGRDGAEGRAGRGALLRHGRQLRLRGREGLRRVGRGRGAGAAAEGARRADTLILADGFSCRGQIESGSTRTGLHLASVLAQAIRNEPLG